MTGSDDSPDSRISVPLTPGFGRVFLLYSGAGILPFLLVCWLLPAPYIPAISAYFLSFLFVGSNLLIIRKFRHRRDQLFYPVFLGSLALRFLLVIATIVAVLQVVKFHHISFTVNFIIAYIFHSVIEIIFLHKTLQNETE